MESIDEEEEDDCKTKNLAKYLGMKDGTSVSISSQVNTILDSYIQFVNRKCIPRSLSFLTLINLYDFREDYQME